MRITDHAHPYPMIVECQACNAQTRLSINKLDDNVMAAYKCQICESNYTVKYYPACCVYASMLSKKSYRKAGPEGEQ
jgi:transposase-like protein